AAQIALDREGVCRRLAVGIGAATACPLRLDAVTSALVGAPLDLDAARSVVTEAGAALEPMCDLDASAGDRRGRRGPPPGRAIADAAAMATAGGVAAGGATAPKGAVASKRGGHVH